MASQWETPPWMIGGNVRHSVNIARTLAYAAFNGTEGVIGPKDLEVRETSPPSGNIRMFPGVCSIINRGTSILYEGYIGRCLATDLTAIPATGGSARTDLIVARVENPYQAGEPFTPPGSGVDPNTVQYIRTFVISGVPSTTTRVAPLGLGYSAIPLARLNIPANTATITQAMITDLRQLTTVRSADGFSVISPTTTSTLTSTAYITFPSVATVGVNVPEWATHFMARATISGLIIGGTGDNGGAGWGVAGGFRLNLGGIATDVTSYNQNIASGQDRTQVFAGAAQTAIPTSLRGSATTLRVEGLKSSGTTSLSATASSTVSIDYRFYQLPESNV